MRRARLWVALLLCLLSLLAGLPLAYANEPPPAPAVVPPGYAPRGLGTTYLALGDSLVIGTEEQGNNDNLPGYPDTLFQYLRTLSPELTLVKLGVDGETSTTMITPTGALSSQLVLAEQLIASERALGRRVGLVTLDIGGNDLVDVLFVGDPATALVAFRANLRIILDRLLAALTLGSVREGDLLLMDYYNPYPGLDVPGRGTIADTYVPQLNAIIKEEAAARGLPVAEVAQAFSGNEAALIYVQRPNGGYPPLNPFDPQIRTKFDYHPRPAGHQAIASNFLNVSGYRVGVYLPLVVAE